MTIFGTAWSELGLANVQAFLDEAEDEPLLWEAKGTKLEKGEVRLQVCAFANSHEGGYLILGARAEGERSERRWVLDGLAFPDEPITWVTNVIADPERGVRPRPDFDVAAWPAPSGHVAVVQVAPTSTPPCITNGTVYERLPGKSPTVRDPQRLADLFARGDQARQDAQKRADRAADTVLQDWINGDAGLFRTEWSPPPATDEDQPQKPDDAKHVRFAIAIAATGNPPNIAGRLFKTEFAKEIWTQLRDRPTGLPAGFGSAPDPVVWSQDALTWRHEIRGHVDYITIVRASWDGSVAVGEKLSMENVYPDSIAQGRIAPDWTLADRLVQQLGGFGDVYMTLVVTGGRFPRRKDTGHIVMRRGPLLPGVDDDLVDGLGRELLRAVGGIAEEP